MHRSLLLLAVTPLLCAPPALAKEGAGPESSCPAPEITHASTQSSWRCM